MNEALLHHIWKYGLFDLSDLKTTTGIPVVIHNMGEHNPWDGPDFSNARISINGVLWAGNVEIHVRSSDWYKHGHEGDPAYKNVILHVVLIHDKEIHLGRDMPLPTIELQQRIEHKIVDRYEALKNGKSWIPCETMLQSLPIGHLRKASALVVGHRLTRKARNMMDEYQAVGGNMKELFYQRLAYSFGLGANAETFRELARNCSYTVLRKSLDSEFKKTAVLLGVSGLLIKRNEHSSILEEMHSEFAHYKQKHGFNLLSGMVWRKKSLRPVSQPACRIAQMSAFLENEPNLEELLMVRDTDILVRRIRLRSQSELSDRISILFSGSKHRMGIAKARSIVINGIVPILYTIGKMRNVPDFVDRAMTHLRNLPAEKNQIVSRWKKHTKISTAWESQGFVELKREFCSNLRCLECPIGISILSKSERKQ